MTGGVFMASTTGYTEETHWAFKEFKTLRINCGRTINRFIRTMITLSDKIRASIAAASNSKAEAKAIYRLINNKKVTEYEKNGY